MISMHVPLIDALLPDALIPQLSAMTEMHVLTIFVILSQENVFTLQKLANLLILAPSHLVIM
jgi:hypothetical protein